MTLPEVMRDLAALGTEQTRRTLVRHGAPEPLFGVRVGDLQPLRRRLRGNQHIALELYRTTNSDAMYLAGLVASGAIMSQDELHSWAQSSRWHLHAGTTVPCVASEHPDAFALAEAWTLAPAELTAIAGWSTLAALVTTRPDEDLPHAVFRSLIARTTRELHNAPDRVRYAMNSFLIACGTYSDTLLPAALASAASLGMITVNMGATACKIPDAASTIARSRRGSLAAPKRKSIRC